ncbi:hypothetical protein AGR9A_Lc40438 [Agrobacterium salinitolerans str. Hayward 0363]|nr:hypothetical protein AGR9A_Lc40438 [Agrobacterium salinitolerans str. Hayward 0363]
MPRLVPALESDGWTFTLVQSLLVEFDVRRLAVQFVARWKNDYPMKSLSSARVSRPSVQPLIFYRPSRRKPL